MKATTIALIASVALNIALGGIAARTAMSARRLESKAMAFDDYCVGVRIAVRQDIADFENPKFQLQALQRFLQPVSGHSFDEIAMCRVLPIDLTRCAAPDDDIACKAELARDVLAVLPRRR